MKYFVYFHDDLYDNGGVGFAFFNDEHAAKEFIEERMLRFEEPNIHNYTIILGHELKLEVVDRITSVSIKDER